jgi:hypothetical protein
MVFSLKFPSALHSVARRCIHSSTIGSVTKLPTARSKGAASVTFGIAPKMSTVDTTPKKKANYEWIYNESNPVAYKELIIDDRDYICDDFNRRQFDRLVLPHMKHLASASRDGTVQVVEIGICFGNTTLALLHGMTIENIKEQWSNTTSCENIKVPRRFPCHVTGIDLSANAVAYCKRVGIADRAIDANLNTQAGLDKILPSVRKSELLILTGCMFYLDVTSVERILAEFANGEGDGYVVVNSSSPFDGDAADVKKQILLRHLDFVGSTASRHRTMSAEEKQAYPDFGDWALFENWTLKRRER